jgi:hypothetical protein
MTAMRTAVRTAVRTATRTGFLRRALIATTIAVLASVPRPGSAQAVRLGVVMDGPRQQLSQAWDELNPRQVERAFCVVDWSFGVYHISRTAPIQDDTVFRVFRLTAAEVSTATPISAEFDCPDGVPELHVHTPTTCMGDDASTCQMGGLNAYSCQPSRGDYEKLVRRHEPFGVIQCDKRAFRFYYPFEYATPDPPTLANNPSSPPASVNGKDGNLTPAMTPGMRSRADSILGPAAGSGARQQQP